MSRMLAPRSAVACCVHRFGTVIALACFGMALTSAAGDSQGASTTLTGGWPARAGLEDRGITPHAVLLTEVWGNVGGGLKRGAWWNQLLDFGVDLDSERLGLWPGGKLVAQGHWAANSQRNRSFADYTGAINPVSGTMASDHIRVFNLFYRQSWSEDMAVAKIGQLAADDDFMGSAYTGLFANAAFGAMPSQVGNRLAGCCGFSPAFPVYPVAAPAVFLSLRPGKPLYAQAGLYYGRPGRDDANNHGFDWVDALHPDVGLFFEAGCHYRLGERAATVRLGLTHHTGRLEGFSASSETSPRNTRQAVPNFYAVHDLELLQDRDGKTWLGLFCRGGLTPDPERGTVAGYADAGVNWFGPIRSRPADVAGIAVSYTRFGRDFRNATGPHGVAPDDTAVEFAYRAEVTRWLTLQADTQLLFNPAQRPESGDRQMATVLGLRARVSF